MEELLYARQLMTALALPNLWTPPRRPILPALRCPRCGKFRWRSYVPDWLRLPAFLRQRDPSTGGRNRDPSTGGRISDDACCCANCFGNDCTYCDSGTTERFYFVSFSGIDFMPSGTCISDGTNSATIDYTTGGTNASGSGCAAQDVDACQWIGGPTASLGNNIGDSFAQQLEYTSDTTCSTSGSGGAAIGVAGAFFLRRYSGGWALAIMGGVDGLHQWLALYATAPASSSDCTNPTITFTNSLTSYGTFTDSIFGFGVCWVVATGGSATMTFHQGCCPS